MTEKELHEEITRRIDACIQAQSTEIDLSRFGLTGKETNLPRLQACKGLTNLYLGDNQISDISFLSDLTDLTNLYLGGNQISDISVLSGLSGLTYLDLSSNRISDISFLKDLTSLTYLDLHSNQISDVSFLKDLHNLTSLDLSSNRISDISFLKDLTSLTYLDLSSSQISDISFLKDLTSLTYLDLHSNRISDISFLKDLTSLTYLNIESNQILDILTLASLINLTKLVISGNTIFSYEPLLNLNKLQNLSISSNKLCDSDISFLNNLNNLLVLNMTSNFIMSNDNEKFTSPLFSKFKESIKIVQETINTHVKDTNLLVQFVENEYIDLIIDNKERFMHNIFENPAVGKLLLTKMGSNKFLTDCLKELFNKKKYRIVFKINTSFHLLKNLIVKKLYFDDNYIDDISFLVGLEYLEYLSLKNNLITRVTLSSLRNFPKLNTLYLHQNPIQNIPKEIFDKGDKQSTLSEVRDYLEDLEKGKQKNNEVKVVFIGNGSVGKTQIAKRLAEKEQFVFDSQHNSTHAITLLPTHIDCDFLPEGLQLNLWDFGGQDIYHATHRMFMQTRALFVLVWDVDNEANPYHTWEGVQYKNEPLQYWLKYASHFGKGSPILVVQNKVDIEAQEASCLPPPEQARLKEEFPNITDFWQCSAKTGHNFDALTYFVGEVFNQHEALRQDLIERELPMAWIEVRNRVRSEQAKLNGAKQIGKDIFQAWCAEADVEKSTETILQFFHDTGVFYYQARYFAGTIILDQAWAIEAVYKVLDRKKGHYKILQSKQGRLDYEWICKIWKEHTKEERELFIDFMLSAELCFRSPQEKNTFIVPQLLKPTKPTYLETYKQEYAMHERKAISYNFLPALFIQHFIVRAHRLAKVEDMWQAGIYLAYQDQRAIVEANYDTSEIVLAYSAQSAELVQAITEELEAISQNTEIKAGENKGLARFWQNFWGKYLGNTKEKHTFEAKNNPIINMANTHTVDWLLIDDSLKKGKYDVIFQELGAVADFMESETNAFYNLKNTFKGGFHDVHFQQRLAVFVQDHDLRKQFPQAILAKNNLPSDVAKDNKKEEEANKEKARKILFISANPKQTKSGFLAVNEEYREINERLDKASQRDKFEMLHPLLEVTLDNLIAKLPEKNPHILHFAGHGSQKGIIIADGSNEILLPIKPFLRLLKDVTNLELLILNCCFSEDVALAISKAFPHVYITGMNNSISDNASIAFAEGIYTKLGTGANMEKSFEGGLIKIETYHEQESETPTLWKDGNQIEL